MSRVTKSERHHALNTFADTEQRAQDIRRVRKILGEAGRPVPRRIRVSWWRRLLSRLT